MAIRPGKAAVVLRGCEISAAMQRANIAEMNRGMFASLPVGSVVMGKPRSVKRRGEGGRQYHEVTYPFLINGSSGRRDQFIAEENARFERFIGR